MSRTSRSSRRKTAALPGSRASHGDARPLREQGALDFAVDIGEAEVAALKTIRQPGVVEPEQVQQRGVQIVDVDPVLNGVEPEFVGLAVDVARPSNPPPATHMLNAFGWWSRPSFRRPAPSGCGRTRRPR